MVDAERTPKKNRRVSEYKESISFFIKLKFYQIKLNAISNKATIDKAQTTLLKG
jgi:hypothetical protein